jgi:hypothetical protein
MMLKISIVYWTYSLSIRLGAKFALCPCCYGQLAVQPGRPRSRALAGSGALPAAAFGELASAADLTVPAADIDFVLSAHFSFAKRCMNAVDTDRLAWVCEASARPVRPPAAPTTRQLQRHAKFCTKFSSHSEHV